MTVHCGVSLAANDGGLAVAERMEAAYEKVDDYTATFLKQEYVGGELLPLETITYKFQKPFKVYMGWREGPHEGREALYVRGRYDNKVVGHEGGWFNIVTLHMDPEGSMAMRGNRHPITDSGIGRLIEIVGGNVRRAVKNGELELSGPEPSKVSGRDAEYYIAMLPAGRDYYGTRIEMWVDSGLHLPVKIKIYDETGMMVESYEYRDIVINPGISGDEFDEAYKGYDF